MATLVLILGVALSISFLCSILEAVFLSVTHSYIAVLRDSGEWAGRWFEKAQKRIDEPIAAILTLNTIAHTMGATMGGAVAAEVFGSMWVAAFSAALTLAVLLLTEIIPKTVGATYWQQLAKPTAYILQALIISMKPVLVPLGWLSRLITPTSERPTISRAELEVLAEIGRREGTLDEDEWQVMSNVIRLDEVSVGEVMTPRIDVVAVPVDATLADAQALMLQRGHFRLPVYEETLDRVMGVVLARDLWQALSEGQVAVRDIMRPVPFAPASKPVEDLIPEMREQRTKLAVVVDEFGGTAGIVTLEDLIEEIIGEIQDEHEDEPLDFLRLAHGRIRVWGGVPLREAAKVLGFDLAADEEEGYDTLGGYLFGRLHRIPEVSDEVLVESGTLQVTRMQGRRVQYVMFTPVNTP